MPKPAVIRFRASQVIALPSCIGGWANKAPSDIGSSLGHCWLPRAGRGIRLRQHQLVRPGKFLWCALDGFRIRPTCNLSRRVRFLGDTYSCMRFPSRKQMGRQRTKVDEELGGMAYPCRHGKPPDPQSRVHAGNDVSGRSRPVGGRQLMFGPPVQPCKGGSWRPKPLSSIPCGAPSRLLPEVRATAPPTAQDAKRGGRIRAGQVDWSAALPGSR